MRKGVVVVGGAVVEVGDAGHDHLLGISPSPHEQIAIALAGHAKTIAEIRRASPRGPGGPARKERQKAAHVKPETFRIRDAFLHRHQTLASDVLWHDHVGGGDHQVVVVSQAAALIVERETISA